MIELYQAEWCPHSHRVRQRLTELGLEFLAHQVPVDPAERTALKSRTGQLGIPTLLLDDGSALCGEDEILATLDRSFAEPPDAEAHRERAVEEWPEWLRLARPSERRPAAAPMLGSRRGLVVGCHLLRRGLGQRAADRR